MFPPLARQESLPLDFTKNKTPQIKSKFNPLSLTNLISLKSLF
jgi:hypothetical protein